MVITFMGLMLNIPLNYMFIYGKFGAPALGGVGCGVATAIVNWAMAILMITYSAKNYNERSLKVFEKIIEKPRHQNTEKIDRTWCPFFKKLKVVLNHSITAQEPHKFTAKP